MTATTPDAVPARAARSATAKTRTPVLQRPLASYYLVLASTGVRGLATE